MDGCGATPSDLERESIADEVLSISTNTQSADEASNFEKKKTSSSEVFTGIKLPDLVFPPSQYDGWQPPCPVVDEEQALGCLLSKSPVKRSTYADSDFISFDLDKFVIYRDSSSSVLPDEMTSLQEVSLKQGNTTFFFDGILIDPDPAEDENGAKFLKRVPFRIASIGGYKDIEQHTVGSDIWIQSVHGGRTQVWYHLLSPSKEYKPYHDAFLWLADFGKHFVDFLSEHETVKVTLQKFRADFASWLKRTHGGDAAFQAWLSLYGSQDFRQAVVAYSDYLFKQAVDIDGKYARHQIWREMGVTQSILKEQPKKVKGTLLTPYVHSCFKDMEWASLLEVVEPTPAVQLKRRQRLQELGFNSARQFSFRAAQNPSSNSLSRAPILQGKSQISPGDVIATEKDENTVWKSDNEDDLWYAFVQGIRQHQNGRIWLDVIWLYRPSDTVCANMTYFHKDELFMSDHCNCGDRKIEITEVVAKLDVSFFSSESRNGADFFVRQIYLTEDEVFMTLKEDDFYCYHRKKRDSLQKPVYQPGDTVLVEASDRLEPVEIINCDERMAEVRELLRRSRDFNDPRSRPNELVYTDRTRRIYVSQIRRRCYVRFYTEGQRETGAIPPPYSRDGNGDAFYITCREVRSQGNDTSWLKPMDSSCWPTTLKEGFDPAAPTPKLRALNIFSGGGNFDRGLEEGTAIKSEWAVEWDQIAMLTYRANHSNPESMKLFWGSVNDFLCQSVRDLGGDAIARVGEVEFISAGSPCQGYSLTNQFKTNEESMRNCSMIASVAAYIDHFRPEYAILENVTAMARKSRKNPLSQMLCALVGMGYQARILNLDAWSFGAPQSRSRLFIFAAAPGLKLPDHPALTHSHPRHTTHRSLGEAANGLPFGNRRWETPVFDYVTAAEATKDLPKIGTGKVMCISRPDHRTSRTESLFTQTQIELIPKVPRTQGLMSAIQRGLMPQRHIDAFARRKQSWTSKVPRSWSRVHPNGLIPTITTAIVPACAFTGRFLHWEQDRVLTVMEARRAQGFPDHEILIGRPTQQWKIVGNSVARQVALALGMTLREACLANRRRNRGSKTTSTVEVVINGVPKVDRADTEMAQASDSQEGVGIAVEVPAEHTVKRFTIREKMPTITVDLSESTSESRSTSSSGVMTSEEYGGRKNADKKRKRQEITISSSSSTSDSDPRKKPWLNGVAIEG